MGVLSFEGTALGARCTPRYSYSDQKGIRGEPNTLSLYVHIARHSVVNNNLDWTNIDRPSARGLDPVGLSVGSGGESPTTHSTVLVAPQGDHIVDHLSLIHI